MPLVGPMSGVTVVRDDERLLAVKRITDADTDRRRREAALLARLDHPGIVQFVELVDGDDGQPGELRLHYAGTDTWERRPPTSTDGIVEGLAVVAATIADLHELGTAHRALAPDHVIVGPDRRPVLCGFADAGPAEPSARADDLAGLADLVVHLSAHGPDELRRPLDDLAARARRGEVSARDLADTLDDLRPRDRGAAPPPSWRHRAPLIAGAAAAATVLATVLAFAALIATDDVDPDDTSSPVPSTTIPSTVPPTSAASTTAPTASSTSAASTTVPGLPPTTSAAPVIVIHDGRRYGIGTAGDQVVLGDWDCDGVATPALLDRGRGLIARFDSWPAAGEAIAAGATAPHPDATAIAVDESHTCDRLRVIEPTGSSIFPEES